MPKFFHFISFHRHRSDSGSSDSSIENCYGNQNTKKQQRLAEKMIKRSNGYGELLDLPHNPHEDMPDIKSQSNSCTTPADHNDRNIQIDHYDALDGSDRFVSHAKQGGKRHLFGHQKLPENHNKEQNHNDQEPSVILEQTNPLKWDEFISEESKHSDHGEHSKHKFYGILAGLTGYGKHQGKNHDFHCQKEPEIDMTSDPWRTDTCGTKTVNIEQAESRRHNNHFGFHHKNHKKHNDFGHQKMTDQLDDKIGGCQDFEVHYPPEISACTNPWGFGTDNDPNLDTESPRIKNRNVPIRRFTFHFGHHGKHHLKHNDFNHHKMHNQDDEHHNCPSKARH